MRAPLLIFAWFSKIVTALIWSGVAYVVINVELYNLWVPDQRDEGNGQEWGTPAYIHWIYLQIIGMFVLFLLAVLPNRWLVSSRIIFVVSLLIALIPLCGAIIANIYLLVAKWSMESELMILAILSAIWPLSLILSFIRLRKGEKIFYA